ncbi:hypothetical protein J3R30DRAFT_3423315 [Lentinula aciculospora]|uniref:Uncharacterized protein n=1 Tax=Lentinula aciculospora TaxID=153920 RepID=A0A9W9AU55_9AGAR|nr:hypothetical protein J3R30DRAFT_3423315 [Lentinula aciculospora]
MFNMANTAEATLLQRVVVMLLVDNNRFTEIAWSNLRDHYLPCLFDKLSSIHPSASITTFVQEFSSNGDTIELSPLAPRKYHTFEDATQDVHFRSHSLRGALLHEAIEFLAATAALARHVVIIGYSPVHNGYPNIDWHHLAQSLFLGRIYCHLMLHAHAAGPTEPLNLMFDETLRLQRLVEDKSCSTDKESQIVPRLSFVRTLTPPLEVTPLKVTSPLIPPKQSLLPAPAPFTRISLPGSRQSMQATTSPASEEELPSIVTQLQQMHGLTKKKVYGTKPKRRPFVSSEVYRESSRKAASLSPVSPSETNHGGRVTSPSLIDRTTRVHHGSVLPHPGVTRSSSLDIPSSSSTSVFNPATSYRPPTMTMSVPSSPIPSPPPLYADSTVVPSRADYYKPQPLPMLSVRPYTVPTSASYTAEGKAYSRGDDGPSSSIHDDRLHLKNQDQDTMVNSTTNYSFSRSVYRDELLSHLGGPSVGSTSSDQHSKHAPSSELSPYVQNAHDIDSYHPSSQPTLWHVPDDSPRESPSNQVHTINQYGMTAGHSGVSSYPSSPISSNSSSLTGWAG